MQGHILIIGAGLAGLEAGLSLLKGGVEDFQILEESSSIVKNNSWKCLGSIINQFNLSDCIAREIRCIHLRACDINNRQIIADSRVESKDFEDKCVILDAEKVYAKYWHLLAPHISLNSKVIMIEPVGKDYRIRLTNGESRMGNKVIDASGSANISDKLGVNPHWFQQKAFYVCYGRRYEGCNLDSYEYESFFDFDAPMSHNGNWFYPRGKASAEIGVSRLYCPSLHKYFPNNEWVLRQDLHAMMNKYLQFPPFDKILPSNREMKISQVYRGFIPLLPRPAIQVKSYYYIGDAKGAVAYSGQGVINALESGRAVAESILFNRPFTYQVHPMSRALCISHAIWNLDASELQHLIGGIGLLAPKDLLKFLTGKLDNSFMLHAIRMAKKQGLNLMQKVPLGLALRGFFRWKPRQSDYAFWS